MDQTDLTFRQVVNPTGAFFGEYEKVPMLVNVRSKLQPEKIDRGLGGILMREVAVEPYIRDLGQYELPTAFSKKFDISPWAFFAAYNRESLIAAATVACKTKEIIMLDGRDDLCLLWDIRVDDRYKRLGVGSKLFEMALDWSKVQGFRQMKIECQNINVPAVRFYHKNGAVLCTLDEYFYYDDPESRDEVALMWYIDL
jgi:GNAT superfamily N-acetyltransferase